jgi:hypothetical protein
MPRTLSARGPASFSHRRAIKWCWKQVLTADGQIDLENERDLPQEHRKHLTHCVNKFSECLYHPPAMSIFNRLFVPLYLNGR